MSAWLDTRRPPWASDRWRPHGEPPVAGLEGSGRQVHAAGAVFLQPLRDRAGLTSQHRLLAGRTALPEHRIQLVIRHRRSDRWRDEAHRWHAGP
ncbi:MAG: hypothetical protein AAF317_15220, partial [Pseudomonadota bacterium]